MACNCSASTGSGLPCSCAPFTLVEDVVGHSLVDELGEVVDCVRDLYTSIGLRTYQVSLVWTRWSGGERGRGQEFIAQEMPLLPTPLLMLDGVELQLKELGLNEQGKITVSQLSPRFTEDLLLGRDGPIQRGRDLPPDVNFFWEVYTPERRGTGVRRRFFPAGVPSKNAGKFEWTIELTSQEGARLRDGGIAP